MKLRPLLLSLAVLVPVSAVVWWAGRPQPASTDIDPRIGQRVAEPSALAGAARVRVSSAGKTLEFARGEGDRWTLAGEPALPADVSRLTRLASDLVSPEIERLVSSRAEKIATYDLESTGVAYLDGAGKALLDLDLGKTLEGGARILRYGDEAKAYAARLNVRLDTEPASWRDTALLAGLKADDIASMSFAFTGETAPVAVSRAKASDPWTSPATPAGRQVKASVLTSQTGNLSTLRYTNIAPNIDPGVVAARVFSREITLATFDGRSVKISFARAPEPPAPPKPEVKEGETAPSAPPAAPRPVYVEITDSKPDAVLSAAAKTHAFEIADWIFTGLPATPADLFEPVSAPPASAVTSPDASANAPVAREPVSVTTPPLTVPAQETASPGGSGTTP